MIIVMVDIIVGIWVVCKVIKIIEIIEGGNEDDKSRTEGDNCNA